MRVSVKLSKLLSDEFAEAYELLLKSKVSLSGASQIAAQYRQISKAVRQYSDACDSVKSENEESMRNIQELLSSDVELTQVKAEDISDVKISTEQYLLISDLIKNNV